MTSTPAADPGIVPKMDADVLARLGITLFTTERYHAGPYRYGALSDALAEARHGVGTERES